VLTPFFLGTALGGIASGRVPVGNAAGDPISSWVNPTSVLVGLLAVLTGAYLAAVYLAGDSIRAARPDLARAFRARALAAGLAAGAVAIGGLAVLRSDAPTLYAGLTSGGGIPLIALSAAGGVTTLALVWFGRFGPARLTAAVAVGCLTVGWALAQSPYILPGRLTLDAAAAPDSTLVAVLVSAGVGMVVLVPSLWLLFRLVLQGRLDQQLEPLDQRFRPLEAGDRRPAPR
jgi:cytochrome bd ubiquinol oxidase subunit II